MVLFFECKGSEGVFVVNFCHFCANFINDEGKCRSLYSFVTEKQGISGIAALERWKWRSYLHFAVPEVPLGHRNRRF